VRLRLIGVFLTKGRAGARAATFQSMGHFSSPGAVFAPFIEGHCLRTLKHRVVFPGQHGR